MGRTVKSGLEYFPLDVDLFHDIKIRKLIKRQGGKAVTVYVLLLCFIYKNGYYIGSDEDMPFIISEQTGYDETYILQVIKNLLSLGLLSATMYETGNVYTSRSIQKRYLSINRTAGRRSAITKYNLLNTDTEKISSQEKPISSQEKPISSQEKPISSQEKPISSQEKPQIKENKRKEKKEKSIKESSPQAASFLPPSPEEVKAFVEKENLTKVDAVKFFNHYESNGWRVGTVPMQNWKAAARSWQTNDIAKNGNSRNTANTAARRGEAGFSATSSKDYSTTF